MSEPNEQTLADELGKLNVGGRLAAPHLPTHKFEIVIEVRSEPTGAAAAFSNAIARVGRLINVDPAGPETTVAGVVGGGFLNLNPAVVEVRIASLGEGRCRATLTGTAKEGLIMQRTGEKAVRRVLDACELAGIRLPPRLERQSEARSDMHGDSRHSETP